MWCLSHIVYTLFKKKAISMELLSITLKVYRIYIYMNIHLIIFLTFPIFILGLLKNSSLTSPWTITSSGRCMQTRLSPFLTSVEENTLLVPSSLLLEITSWISTQTSTNNMKCLIICLMKKKNSDHYWEIHVT